MEYKIFISVFALSMVMFLLGLVIGNRISSGQQTMQECRDACGGEMEEFSDDRGIVDCICVETPDRD